MGLQKKTKILDMKKDVKSIISTEYKTVVIISLLNLILIGLSVIQPRIYKTFVDDVLIKKQFYLIIYIIGLYLLLFLVSNALSLVVKYSSNKIMNRINFKVQSKLYTNIFLKDNICQYNPEYLKSIIESDSGSYWNFINLYYLSIPNCIVLFGASLVLSFLISPILLLSAVIIAPLSTVVSRKIGKHFNKINNEIFQIENRNKSYLSNNIKKWREIKAYNIDVPILEKYKDLLEDEKKLKLTWIKAYNFRDIFFSIKNHFFLNIVPYFIGGILILYQKISVGSLLMFMGYFSMMVSYFDQIIQNYSSFLGMQNNFERLKKIIGVDEKQQEEIDKIYNIKIENVSFKYSAQGTDVIKDFSMRINQNDKIWVKGRSGIGKTTLIKLILNIEQPNEGKITVNGLNISSISQIALHKKIGVIMQESFFFNLSIYDNLRFFNSRATKNEIEKACVEANIHDYIMNLPNGYDTIIGENGVKLSGGQRQRLAIARIILYDPEFIILDEATSALDHHNEQIIYENISKLFEDKIVMVISHKNINFPFTKILEINSVDSVNKVQLSR